MFLFLNCGIFMLNLCYNLLMWFWVCSYLYIYDVDVLNSWFNCSYVVFLVAVCVFVLLRLLWTLVLISGLLAFVFIDSYESKITYFIICACCFRIIMFYIHYTFVIFNFEWMSIYQNEIRFCENWFVWTIKLSFSDRNNLFSSSHMIYHIS